MSAAAQLGALLGVGIRYGMPTVQDAIAAAREGKATPEQQRIIVQVIEAVAAK